MFFKWIVLGFLISVCFCEDTDKPCPKSNYSIKINTEGECPYLNSPYYWKNRDKIVCCDNLSTCGSRLDFNSTKTNGLVCQDPRNLNMSHVPYLKKNKKWIHPEKDEKGFYKECGHDYHCNETQYCMQPYIRHTNGSDIRTFDSKNMRLKYCFNKPANYYMNPGRTCNPGNHTECRPGYCKDTKLGFHMCVHPMQNYCEGQYPAVNHTDECKSTETPKIDGTYCGETDDGRRTWCATKPKHINTTRTCNLGLMVLPRQYCKRENKCGNGGKGVLTRWCDYDSKVCCELNKQEPYWKYYCPDNQTPIYGQPPCNGTGMCEGHARGLQGACVNGRCCPNLVHNPFHDQYAKLPLVPFETEVPCNASKPTNWRYAFCDETSGKIVTFSHYSVSGWPHVIVPMRCAGNLDCHVPWFSYSSPVCVHTSKRQSYCVATPLKPMLLTAPIWYRKYSGWFSVLHYSWGIIAAILAVYSYWDWTQRNRSAHELN